MPDTSAILNLPYIQPSQAQKHVTHNEALKALDIVVQLSVLSASVTTPPGSPQDGDRYLVPTGASGAWAGQDDAIAVWDETLWAFYAPNAGWTTWVEDTEEILVYSAGSWGTILGDLQNLTGVGISATSDATNRLSVAAPATLLSHDGSDHQLKVNKNLSTDTASLLFQTGFSGRAEMGLAGSDNFVIKSSADGVVWVDSLTVHTDGSVGIGASPASEKLEVNGNVLADAHLTPSDRRLKDNIRAADSASDKIDAIAIVAHDWTTGGHVAHGVIAQDLAKICPEAVCRGDDGQTVAARWSVDYAKLVPLLIKEVQDLRERVSALEAD